MHEGKPVRLIMDPGRVGYCTGRTLSRGGREHIQIRFNDSTTSYVPLDQLDFVARVQEDPYDLLCNKRLGSVADLRRTITHVRLSGRLIDLIYSMEITNTDFYAYQFKPVIKILNSASNGILIADEVGLGKTIEAGLIWTELRCRYDLRRLMVLCPAILREKWQLELQTRFGIHAEIVDSSQTLAALKKAKLEGPLASFAIIGSFQGLRQTRDSNSNPSNQLRQFLEEIRYDGHLIDCLVIDEAHYLRNPESRTCKLGKNLRQISDYTILLSATPIHLKNYDLYQLLNLLDQEVFNQSTAFDNILHANAPLIKARDTVINRKIKRKEFVQLIEDAKNNPLLKTSRQLQDLIKFPPSDEELETEEKRVDIASRLESINLLSHVVNRTRKKEVKEWHVLRDPTAQVVSMSAVENDFYQKVTKIVREYSARSKNYEGFLLVTPQRQMASSMPAAIREWQRRNSYLFQDTLDQEIEYDANFQVGPLTFELITQASTLGNYQQLYDNDSKFHQLQKVLVAHFKERPKEKIIIFSYFRPTIAYLAERLQTLGFKSLILKGGDKQNKQEIIKTFEHQQEYQILLSTEIGSEGIDLQFCRILINYDLPWNPMRVEQRIGRIDRIGQKAKKIAIWNILYENTIDIRIYNRLYQRLKIFQEALGGLEPIIGDIIRKMTIELLKDQLTPEEEERIIEETAIALENNKKQEEDLEKESINLVAYGDYLLRKIHAARELHRVISGEEIKNYVTDFYYLYYQGCEFKQLKNNELLFEVKLSEKAKYDLEVFNREQRSGLNTRLSSTSTAPVKCRFENKLFLDETGVEIINQIHPVTKFISHRIKKEEIQIFPAVTLKLRRNDLPDRWTAGLYAFSVQLWSIHGLSEIEKLHYAATLLTPKVLMLNDMVSEELITVASRAGLPWYNPQIDTDWNDICEIINEYCLGNSNEKYKEFHREQENMNFDRAEVQLANLEAHLNSQKKQLLEMIERQYAQNMASIARMNEGRLNNFINRIERQRMDIVSRKAVAGHYQDICVGLIEVID